MDTLYSSSKGEQRRVQEFTEKFLRNFLTIRKLHVNSACFASHCKGITY